MEQRPCGRLQRAARRTVFLCSRRMGVRSPSPRGLFALPARSGTGRATFPAASARFLLHAPPKWATEVMKPTIHGLLGRIRPVMVVASCIGVVMAYLIGTFVTGPFHQASSSMGAMLACTSAVVVLQTPGLRESLRAGLLRVAGTALGALLAYAYLRLFAFSTLGMMLAVALLVVLSMLLGIPDNGRMATITLLAILLVSQRSHALPPGVNCLLRFVESALGVAVGVVLAWLTSHLSPAAHPAANSCPAPAPTPAAPAPAPTFAPAPASTAAPATTPTSAPSTPTSTAPSPVSVASAPAPTVAPAPSSIPTSTSAAAPAPAPRRHFLCVRDCRLCAHLRLLRRLRPLFRRLRSRSLCTRSRRHFLCSRDCRLCPCPRLFRPLCRRARRACRGRRGAKKNRLPFAGSRFLKCAGPVSRVLSPELPPGLCHLSRAAVSCRLKQPTPRHRASNP